jgi:hypothetical protein
LQPANLKPFRGAGAGRRKANPEPKLTQKKHSERFKQTARRTYEVFGTLKDLGIAARDAETGSEGLHLDRWLIVQNHVQQ